MFRHTVEELFTAGLIKAVFATETLALGINMPARTVVLERLVKFNGEQHMPLTPGEYTQLTGRAGPARHRRRGSRRGAVAPRRGTIEPAEVAGLASTRTFPLRSSFAPSYNMTINLVNQMGPEQAHRLLERSFAQYQADRSVVGLVRGVERGQRMLYEVAAELGGSDAPILDYARLREQIIRARARTGPGVAAASPPGGQRRAVGAAPRRHHHDHAWPARRLGRRTGTRPRQRRPAAAGADRTPLGRPDFVGRLLRRVGAGGLDDVAQASRTPTTAGAPRSGVGAAFGGRRPAGFRRPRAASAAERRDIDPELAALRETDAPPSRRTANADREAQVRMAERYLRIERDNEALQKKVAAATNSLARTFDRIVGLLTERGFIAREPTAIPR